MGYYDEKKRELTELLKLVRKEKADFENIAKLEKEDVDKKINLLNELGIYGEQDSEFKELIEAKDKLNREKSEFETYKEYEGLRINGEAEKMKGKVDSYRLEVELQLEKKREGLINLAKGQVDKDREATVQLAKGKSQGFPWLAKAYADYFHLQDLEVASYLESKLHPALKAAEEHRQIAKEHREAEKAARIANYLLDYCRYLAPWLDEYIGMEAEELDEIIKDIHSSWEKKEKKFDEEAKRHYGPKEYERLTPVEKLQRKLDWYWQKPNKSNWQIGRDYERYIGYLYWQEGWDIDYHGRKGYEDLGRDLICKKDNAVEIVQCKYWAREKIIHEKHIYYLFGTTVDYFLENFAEKEDLKQLALFPILIEKRNVIPKLITTIEVAPKAEQVAKVLGVAIEKIPSEHYPSVKCNVSRRTGEKIYHLPFDQQYDTTKIEDERLERYVATVDEAEALGFRHAYRWRGEVSN